MKHFAPMIFPNIAGVTDFVSGAGNPNLTPLLREEKIRSSVENCAFFGVFASDTSKKEQSACRVRGGVTENKDGGGVQFSCQTQL